MFQLDTKSYLQDSPVPPILMSSVKEAKPTTSDLRVTSRRGMETASPEPEAPTVTAWAKVRPSTPRDCLLLWFKLITYDVTIEIQDGQ